MVEAGPSDTKRIPLYEASTQFKHWRFSPEQLALTRETLNTAAASVIRKAFEADAASRTIYSRMLVF
jgi:cyclin H